MDDKTTQNTFLKMKQRHTIETAASLIVLDDVVQEEKWRNNAGIQEAYKVLRDKTLKAFRYSKLKISVYEAIELLENNPYLAEAIRKYPDLTRKDLVTAVERFFERELAVSRISLGNIINGENWRDILEIQIQKPPVEEMLSYACRSLFEDVCKACRKSESILKKDKIIELVENHNYVNTAILRYPNIERRHFVTMIERLFEKALSEITRTFNEISEGLNTEYQVSKACSGIKDYERDIEYTLEYIKTAKEVHCVINALIENADEFGLYPRFYPEEEAETDYSRFYPISLKPGIPKGYIEVRTKGIMACDVFFNFAPEKPAAEVTDAPVIPLPIPTVPVAEASTDDSGNQPTRKPKKTGTDRKPYTDPFSGLDSSVVDKYKNSPHFDNLTDKQFYVFVLREAFDLEYTEIGVRMGTTRQDVTKCYEIARNKLEKTRKKDR